MVERLKNNKLDLKISHRLYGGFAAVVALLAIAVIVTLWQVAGIKNTTDRIVSLRMPTAQASAAMTNSINASLAALRGWMLTGNESFKQERAQVWRDIADTRAHMDELAQSWTNPSNVTAWQEFKVTLAEFEAAQAKVETVANSADEQPALKMLVNEAAPKAAIMSAAITEMIDLELAGGSDANISGDRVQFLGMMADVRGTLGLGLANIRAYLLTGDDSFVETFNKLWAKNERRFNDLSQATGQMSLAQRGAFNNLSSARVEFSPLPPKMFEIRGSNQWNMANYLLVMEAAPRAGKLLTTLVGPKQADGVRSGGMVDNQKALLEGDAAIGADNTSFLLSMQWVLLALGVISGGAIAFFTARSISDPLLGMTEAMKHLAQGDLETEVPAQDRSDEIGDMSAAVQVFKENGIRVKAAEEQKQLERQKQEEEQAARDMLTEQFAGRISNIVGTLSSASTELTSTAQSMSTIAEETNSQSRTVATASEQATGNVQTVASASEEMFVSIAEISQQVASASTSAKTAVDEVGRTSAEIEALAKTADGISEVVAMISDIADQTNLLALNATIESARAGEAGKGFAVVASEVKSLAGQTAKATEEIAKNIGDIQSATRQAADSMGGIGNVIGTLEEISTSVAAAMEEQEATIQEIARNMQEAASGTQEVASSITGVTEASQETGSAAEQVTSAADELSSQSEVLRSEVDGFVQQLKAS